MTKLLASTAAALCLFGLVACAPAPPPGSSPSRPGINPEDIMAPSPAPTETPDGVELLPDDAYLRIRATGHLTSGGTLDLVLTVFEPTIDASTPASTITAVSEGCFLYDDYRA